MRRQYELLPASVRDTLPPLYTCEHEDDPLVRVKLFTPDSSWTWFVLEGSVSPATERYTLFALVVGFDTELGYVDLQELEEARGQLGLPVERDLHFAPARLSEIRKQIGDVD